MKSTMIKEIRNYSVVEDRLFYESNSKEFFINGELLYSNVLGHSTFQRNVVVTLETSENKNNSILIFNGIIKKFEFSINPIYVSSKFIFVRHEISSDRKKWSYFLFDSINEKVTFYSKNYHCLAYPCLFDENLFSVNESLIIISNLNLPTETTLWQYSVADLGAEKVSKIMGVFGQTLVVVSEMPHPTIKNIPIELYLGIDIQSGQLVWQTQEIILPNGETDYMGGNQNRWQWHESATTLYALAGRNYFEFDTQTGQINIPTDIFQQLLARHLDSIQSNSMEGDFLYFRAVDNTLGGFHSAIGAFNIIEKQITWHHTLKDMFESGGFIKNDQPKVSGNKIYVLDSKNTLHIFERENETPDLNQ